MKTLHNVKLTTTRRIITSARAHVTPSRYYHYIPADGTARALELSALASLCAYLAIRARASTNPRSTSDIRARMTAYQYDLANVARAASARASSRAIAYRVMSGAIPAVRAYAAQHPTHRNASAAEIAAIRARMDDIANLPASLNADVDDVIAAATESLLDSIAPAHGRACIITRADTHNAILACRRYLYAVARGRAADEYDPAADIRTTRDDDRAAYARDIIETAARISPNAAALIDRLLQGDTVADAAAACEINPSTARAIIHRIRKAATQHPDARQLFALLNNPAHVDGLPEGASIADHVLPPVPPHMDYTAPRRSTVADPRGVREYLDSWTHSTDHSDAPTDDVD